MADDVNDDNEDDAVGLGGLGEVDERGPDSNCILSKETFPSFHMI